LKILTTVKKVVDVELNIQVKDGKIVRDGLQYVMNAWDENAVEASVQLKESNDAETTLVCMGDSEATLMIRKAFAMGIENGIHIDDPLLETADSNSYAKVLQKIVETGNYDLIITGKQAQDTDNGHTGIMLAEYLDFPCVSNVISIEVTNESQLTVSRIGDAGTELIDVILPAVLTVSDSINEPRLPALRGIMMAKKKVIETKTLSDLGLIPEQIDLQPTRTEILEYQTPTARAAGKKFEGEAAEITAKVVQLLSNEAKVI
jgi:electron transfer flavoprotein beta subunit